MTRTQKPTEGTGIKTSHFFRRKPMSKVVYRGHAYDTEERRQQQQQQQQPQAYNESYRGIKFVKEDK